MTLASQRPSLTLDVTPLLDEQWTGIPIFTRRLVRALLRSDALDLRFCIGLTMVSTEAVQAAIRSASGAFLRDDVLHRSGEAAAAPDFASPLLFPSVKRTFGFAQREASTVHDMSTLFMPENHQSATVALHLDHFAHELATNDVTFCASDATRAALTLAFPSVADRARTIYQYVDWPGDYAAIEHNLPRIKLGRYAAVIGTIEPRKNLALLLRALSHPHVRKTGLHFIVIGRKGWLVGEFDPGPDAVSRISFTGFVSEFVKYRILKNAEFLIYPSVYEGFGIPALEAMSLGKPVLAARTSSFPEVVGEAGLYFDPFSLDEFASTLREISAPARLAELGDKALEQSRAFTAKRMAQPVLDWLARS